MPALAFRINVEYFLLQWLPTVFGYDVNVVRRLTTELHETVLGPDPDNHPELGRPVIWLRRTGGADDGAGLDHATVVAQVFAADDLTGWQVAETVRSAIHSLDGVSFADGTFGETGCTSAPAQLPYADPVIALFEATYRLDIRATP